MTRMLSGNMFRRRMPPNFRGKFIPDGDREFAAMARNFADVIERDPAAYFLSTNDAQTISAAVQAYRDALAACLRKLTKSKRTVMLKDTARDEAERVVREHANLIRPNPAITDEDKLAIGIRRKRPRNGSRNSGSGHGRSFGQPYLRFIAGRGSVHVLEFRDEFGSPTKAKPVGAARLELFAALVEPGERVPMRPDERCKACASCDQLRGRYMRSFTRNPIEVEYPVSADPSKAKLVVYWGRWADVTGEVGPWSSATRARVEGGG